MDNPGFIRSPLRRLLALGGLVSIGFIGGCGSDDPKPYTGPGCAIQEAEHPAYTTPTRDAALCGARYDTTNIATACDANYHVCRESEWHDLYPEGVDPMGTLTTWGAEQSTRCIDVWQAYQPVDARVWYEAVCNDPYNPWNNGKYLLSDDGSTILEGDGGCCGWDSAFGTPAYSVDFAVYCCKD